MLVAKVTRNVLEIEVAHDERYSGESKYSIKKLMEYYFKIFFCYNDFLFKFIGCRSPRNEYSIRKKIENGEETCV